MCLFTFLTSQGKKVDVRRLDNRRNYDSAVSVQMRALRMRLGLFCRVELLKYLGLTGTFPVLCKTPVSVELLTSFARFRQGLAVLQNGLNI